jgi:hypothetical protein
MVTSHGNFSFEDFPGNCSWAYLGRGVTGVRLLTVRENFEEISAAVETRRGVANQGEE